MKPENENFVEESFFYAVQAGVPQRLRVLAVAQAVIETGWGVGGGSRHVTTRNWFGIEARKTQSRLGNMRVFDSITDGFVSWLWLMELGPAYGPFRKALVDHGSPIGDAALRVLAAAYCPGDMNYPNLLIQVYNEVKPVVATLEEAQRKAADFREKIKEEKNMGTIVTPAVAPVKRPWYQKKTTWAAFLAIIAQVAELHPPIAVYAEAAKWVCASLAAIFLGQRVENSKPKE